MEPKGIILFAEDLEILKNLLSESEAFAVVYALSCYGVTGEVPDGLSPAQMMAFEMMRQKVDRMLKSYANKSEKRASAARARWDAKASDASDAMQTDANDANASDASDAMQTMLSKTETETKTEVGLLTPQDAPPPAGNVIAFDGSDMTDAIRTNQTAQRLVATYLPGNPRTPLDLDPRVGDIAADIAKHGVEKVEAALKAAKESDNRGGASLRFYRAILNDAGKPKPSRASPEASGYMTGADHRDDAFWRGLEVNLDAETS